jgi:hypothetical protein
MKREFLPYNEALELKAIGFDEPCAMYWRPEMDGSMQMWYHQDERFDDAIGSQNSDDAEWVTCTAPLYQQAFRWFREKYNMVGEINSYYSDKKWSFNYDIVTIYKEKASDRFNTYEEAELECLLKLIEIVKEK